MEIELCKVKYTYCQGGGWQPDTSLLLETKGANRESAVIKSQWVEARSDFGGTSKTSPWYKSAKKSAWCATSTIIITFQDFDCNKFWYEHKKGNTLKSRSWFGGIRWGRNLVYVGTALKLVCGLKPVLNSVPRLLFVFWTFV
jgi:hypothetical protein